MFWRSLGKGHRMRAAMLCVITGAALATTAYSAQVKWVPLNKSPLAKPNPSTPSAPVAAEPQAPSPTAVQMASAVLDQMENQRHWGSADRIKAKNLSGDVDHLWISCLNEAELRLRDSKDEVAMIATAVLGSCEVGEHLLDRTIRLVFRGYDPVKAEGQVERIERDVHEQAREGTITHLVKYRLSRPQPTK